mmetsp:Transcript_17325/g.34827  ORF Transcript_17325/g.34827 Transcript_17325/m.34827 type:complete len:170 (+) Transcript_17325:3-512(+)
MSLASFLGMVLLFSLLPPIQRQRTLYHPHTLRQGRQKQTATTLVLFGGIYGACRIAGRQTLVHYFWEPSRIHVDELDKATSGTVGVAFPQSSLPILLSFLQTRLEPRPHNVLSIDVLLNRWIFDATNQTLRAFRIQPSLVQHTGAYSSANYKNQGMFENMKQDSTFVVE